MKSAFKFIAAIVAIGIVVVVAILAVTFSGNRALVDGVEVVPGVRVIKDGIVASYMVDAGPGAVVLIDAGNDKKGGPILAELARRGLGVDAVKAVFLTHGHADHTGALPLFPKADIYAMGADEPLLEGTSKGHAPISFLMPSHPTGLHATHQLSDGEVVNVGNLPVRAFAAPGHTGGSAVYLAHDVLFFGDSAGATSDGRMIGTVWLFSESQKDNVTSLQKLANRLTDEPAPIKALAFGHTGPLEGMMPLIEFARPH